MKIVVLPSAKDDLADGFDFYEQQDAGLGGYFFESPMSAFQNLSVSEFKDASASQPVRVFSCPPNIDSFGLRPILSAWQPKP